MLGIVTNPSIADHSLKGKQLITYYFSYLKVRFESSQLEQLDFKELLSHTHVVKILNVFNIW